MRKVIQALLAASMLMPVAAQAQEQDGRERRERPQREWGERREHPQRSAEVGVDAQIRAERPQWRDGGRDGGRGEARLDRPQRQSGNDPRPDRGDWQRRPGGWDRPQAQQQGAAPQARGGGDEGRWNRGDRSQPGMTWSGPARVDRRTVDGGGAPGWRDDDRRGRPDWRDDRGRDGYAQRGGYDQRGWTGRRGGYDGRSWDQRAGGWNRGWRNDRRYDWNGYRQANRGAYRLPRYYAPSGWGYGYRRFSVGVSLSSILFSQNYWIDDPYAYRLPDAYGPYRWVRYYDDALLVDVRSGVVVDVVYDIFD